MFTDATTTSVMMNGAITIVTSISTRLVLPWLCTDYIQCATELALMVGCKP